MSMSWIRPWSLASPPLKPCLAALCGSRISAPTCPTAAAARRGTAAHRRRRPPLPWASALPWPPPCAARRGGDHRRPALLQRARGHGRWMRHGGAAGRPGDDDSERAGAQAGGGACSRGHGRAGGAGKRPVAGQAGGTGGGGAELSIGACGRRSQKTWPHQIQLQGVFKGAKRLKKCI
ncbi:hypothetical protein PVAP13_3NG249840 [Panicum virgatum]|uniref:Uncharacterized protein n=1 Tax=Panicum virgatum TaxID=38727 RepID=A0A8T0U6R6_PANVG|nr:hypothetical protein PVAP13_3NG249840 [Panicum virgatum]